jgi:predicted permease
MIALPARVPVAVASWGWFQSHFQGNPSAIGQSVRIQGHDYTIVGVASPRFIGLSPAAPADLWIPLSMEKEISPGWNGLTDHDFRSLYLIGRLKPGVSLAQAGASTNLLFRQIIQSEYLGDHPSSHDLTELQHANIELTSAAGGLPRLRLQFSAPLEILMGIVLLVLLIACANIANMRLARGVARSRELAVRQALGATRRRIVVQLLTETFVLALIGAILGVLLAWRGSHLLLALASQGPKAIPLDLTPDYRVLSFTLSVTVLTALLFGIAPALRATRLELTPSLKDGRGGSTASVRGTLSRSLIVSQIALSILLLAAAGLFLRSLRNLTTSISASIHSMSSSSPSTNMRPTSRSTRALSNYSNRLNKACNRCPAFKPQASLCSRSIRASGLIQCSCRAFPARGRTAKTFFTT